MRSAVHESTTFMLRASLWSKFSCDDENWRQRVHNHVIMWRFLPGRCIWVWMALHNVSCPQSCSLHSISQGVTTKRPSRSWCREWPWLCRLGRDACLISTSQVGHGKSFSWWWVWDHWDCNSSELLWAFQNIKKSSSWTCAIASIHVGASLSMQWQSPRR